MTFSEKFEEETVELKALGTKEYEQIEARVRANRRGELTTYLNECKIQGPERFVSLRDARVDNVTVGLVWTYLNTGDGARHAVTLALTKAGKSAEQATELYERLDFPDASDLALALVRFKTRFAPKADEGDGKAGDPLQRRLASLLLG